MQLDSFGGYLLHLVGEFTPLRDPHISDIKHKFQLLLALLASGEAGKSPPKVAFMDDQQGCISLAYTQGKQLFCRYPWNDCRQHRQSTAYRMLSQPIPPDTQYLLFRHN